MNFIKQIFDGKIDEKTHLQFQKFSRGKFINRALLEIKNSKGKYTLKTSPEFANYLVNLVAEKSQSRRGKNRKSKNTYNWSNNFYSKTRRKNKLQRKKTISGS